MTIINVTNAYHPVKQPTNANRVQTLLQPARRPSQTSQDQLSDQTPEGKPPSQVFIAALPTLNIIHSSHNTPSLFKLALS